MTLQTNVVQANLGNGHYALVGGSNGVTSQVYVFPINANGSLNTALSQTLSLPLPNNAVTEGNLRGCPLALWTSFRCRMEEDRACKRH